MVTTQFGKKSEDEAVKFLENNNFIIIERNFYAKKMGEIDIIAQKNNTLHFIEVKSSSTKKYQPVYNLSPRKLKKMINSTQYYLKIKNLNLSFCLDAIIITDGDIEFLENITL
ncbi:putative protein [hydrothermal vent metagenome]|uniref:Uncharacterized protein n=1 Tax=hydrothermal vent metagenome TaxID=652676 RepID=A0A1W1EL77_9ZZZZ